MLFPKYCSISYGKPWFDWFWNVLYSVSGTSCFCEYTEVKMSELKRQPLLMSFIWGFLWFKCPFFRMGTELQSKLNLNQEKQFSQHTLITHKYSHGSEESLWERIEGFSPMVLEIVGADLKDRCSTDIYRKIHSFFCSVFILGWSQI